MIPALVHFQTSTGVPHIGAQITREAEHLREVVGLHVVLE